MKELSTQQNKNEKQILTGDFASLARKDFWEIASSV
jgi:hypothetical protein